MRFNRLGLQSSLPILTWILAAAAVTSAALAVVWNRDFRHASAADPGTSCPVVIAPKSRPPLTAIGVHRVALIGDSIMSQASCSAAESLAGAGIQTARYAVSGSGLLTGSVDWLRHTQDILRWQHPNAVLAIFVGNYWGAPIRDANGQSVADDSPAFFVAWQQRAQLLSNEVRAAGAQMYWVSPPPIALPPLSHAERLFAGYRSIPGDHVLDSGSVLAGPNGEPVMTKQTCGSARIIRSVVDGIHLSNDGARLYGQQIAHDFTAQLGLFTTPKPC
jgi:hypothetical protein